MKNYLYLSHFLSEQTPLYRGEKNISIRISSSIKNGDSANTKLLSFPNHAGTHIDAPRHFSDEGRTIQDYDPSFWVFHHPYLLFRPAQENEMIDLKEEVELISAQTDFLIVRTNFQRCRHEEKYWAMNPSISSSSAPRLKSKCPGLRVIGFDFISISGYQQRTTGREAHKEFLLHHHILVIEDMKLDMLNASPRRIMAFPLLLDQGDGAPITIIAEMP